MKKHKGLLAGICLLVLNLLIFGFLPVPMFAHTVVSLMGEVLYNINDSIEPKMASIVIASIILLCCSFIFILKIRKSKNRFDWLVALMVIQFFLLNGIGFKYIELVGTMPGEMKFDFILRTSVVFIWIYPLIGWCYDRWWNVE